MFTPLTVTVVVTGLLLAVWCGYASFRDQPVKDWHYGGAALVEVFALAQAVVSTVALAGGDRPAGEGSTVVFVCYLVAVPLCLPLTVVVSFTERNRWGSATVAVGAAVAAVLELRLADVWAGAAGV
ncbi:hypothetical protein SAMN06297387_103132 [Streptomyces zhaozhouensis]|uniref:Uncharacterized protein n=1 Tax=Streptomyces zhaozhouensis TaxID=1300267 RepID=A0A286DRT6_9ACTN|nr:hypothetical protein [Streptomyces zhaozhouensis]SOD61382.1 hypothetical protein SAMN06297387_103132 [Streptomyces zhaozhouensis]